eukprot:144725_1
MGCLQAQEEHDEETDKRKPLLPASSKSGKDAAQPAKYTESDEKEPMEHDTAPDVEDTEQKSNPNTALPGQCLIEQTFDLQKDLESLRSKYPDQFKALLKREMVSVKTDREMQNIEQNSIVVMQFNMLADGLSTSYMNAMTEKTFLNVDKECLQWTYRGLRLAEEMSRYSADVICMQECDQLPFLMQYMSRSGYKSYFQQKTKSKIPLVLADVLEERGLSESDSSIQMPKDGVALLYKTKTFEVAGDVQYVDMKENEESVFGLAVPLRIKSLNQEILLITTHLKSKKTEDGEQLRVRQINALIKREIKNEKNLPLLLVCDLNSNPVQNKKGYDPLCYNSIVNKDNLAFESVYKLANGAEPEYTTFKARKHGVDKHTLDYIFIKGGKWNVTQVLPIPKVSQHNVNELIPNWHYPSDHFSIAAQLTWQ